MSTLQQIKVAPKGKKSLLWAISSGDGPPSYLFGTMHVRSSIAHQFLTSIRPFMEQTATLAAEMNLDEFDQAAMFRGSNLPQGQTLGSLLGEKKYQKIKKSILKSFDLDLGLFQHRHPFLVSAALSESLLVVDQLESLDQEIWNRAKSLNLTCVGLESFDEQMTIMQQMPMDDLLRQVKEIGRNPKRFRRSLHKMIKYYVDQDVVNLYKSSRRQLQGMRKKLLFDRNKRMAKRFVDLLEDSPVFAAVGAGHLAGEKGMLRFIRKMGFKVTPIKMMP